MHGQAGRFKNVEVVEFFVARRADPDANGAFRTFEALRLQGEKLQQLLNVGNALQIVYPLYGGLGP